MLELRSLSDGDAEAVWRLHDVALDVADAHRGHGPWEDDLRLIRASYIDPGGAFLVGLVDEQLVAMGGVVRRGADEAEIRRMRVHPDHQRRGYGRLMLEQRELRARALGCRRIHLDTTDRQTAA